MARVNLSGCQVRVLIDACDVLMQETPAVAEVADEDEPAVRAPWRPKPHA